MSAIITWKPISGYNGFYEVSNTGAMRSVERTIMLPNGKTRKIPGKTLAPKRNADGYLFVTLSMNGIATTVYIHRAVAKEFADNPLNLLEVNHRSGDKTDNTANNLEWCTRQQNVRHCYDTGLCNNKGGNHKFAVGVIDNALGKKFDTIKEWCEARNIKYSTGRNLLAGFNTSKTIDLSTIFKEQKNSGNGQQ